MDAEESTGGLVGRGSIVVVPGLEKLVKIPDPTKEWVLTESDKRLLISVADKWVMMVLNDVAARQADLGLSGTSRPTEGSTCGPTERRSPEEVKRGRPKVHPDRKTQMRELMRKRRAKP